MAIQQTVQVVGNANSTAAEVDTQTKALHSVLRAKDFDQLGDYSISSRSTIASASTSAVSGFVFGFFWEHLLHVAVIERINFNSVLTVSGTGSVGNHTANLFHSRYVGELGAMLFNATAANAATVLYPTTAATSGGTGKLDDGDGDSGAIIALSATSGQNGFAFPAATGAFFTEPTPVSSISASVPLVSGKLGINGDLWNTTAGDHPLTLISRGQCLLVQFIAPTASVAQTIDIGATVTWREVASYP